MKKVIVILAVLALAMPSMAASITVTGSATGVTGTVGFSGNGQNARPDAARASGFALTLTIDNDATFETVTPTITGVSKAATPGYGIFPGTIVIDDNGVVTDYNTPVEKSSTPGAGSSGLHTNKIVVALGALYVTDANKPGASGNLFSFTVSKACNVTMAVESTYRGGVIAEDSNPMTVTFSPSSTIVVPGLVQIPPPPTGVSATDGTANTTITVTWNASTGATGYDVYKSFTNSITTPVPTLIGTGNQTSPFVFSAGTTQTNAEGRTTYFFVKAKNSAGASAFSTGDAGYISECVKSTAPFITYWRNFGRPNCWAFQRNCRGDTNGTRVGSVLTGYRWVTSEDLTIFAGAFNLLEPALQTNVTSGVPGICADYNRARTGSVLTGYRWVTSDDLTIFAQYYNLLEPAVPVCAQTNYNFWKN